MAQGQKTEDEGTNIVGAGYDDTFLENNTGFTAHAHVRYRSTKFCNGADPVIAPHGNWTESRGVCLICEISAFMQNGSELIRAESYGPLTFCTSSARFMIVDSGHDTFKIIPK